MLATLRATALNLPRLAGFRLIRAILQTVTHDITSLLEMAWYQPEPGTGQDFESALGSKVRL